MKRGIRTREEDAKMLAYVSKHGAGNWSDVPKKAGLKRCGKSCRLRWTNYLRPDLNQENFTTQEEELIIRLHAAIGSRWSIIAQQLPGRTDNDVKNYWNTRLRKKLSEMGIDPVTHKPFSQIIEDYGNIGGFGRSGTRVGPLNLKHSSFVTKTEQYRTRLEAVPSSINSHLVPAISSPGSGSFQDILFNSNIMDEDINNSYNNRTSDILGPLQAMKLMTEAAQCNTASYGFPKEDSSWSSTTTSSSSTCSTAGQETSSLTCSWRDYLVEDEFLPTDYDHFPREQELSMPPSLSNNYNMGQVQNAIPQVRDGTPQGKANHEASAIASNSGIEWMNFSAPENSFQGGSSSSMSSFIDSMLDKDNETFLCFPNLLEEPFYY